MLSVHERKLLSETRDILEELLETEEVLRDKTLMSSINNGASLYTLDSKHFKPLRAHGLKLFD